VKGHLGAIHLRFEGAIGLDGGHTHAVSGNSPLACIRIVVGYGFSGDGQAGPVDVVVFAIAAEACHFGIKIFPDPCGKQGEPFLNAGVLIGRSQAAGTDFEIGDGDCAQQPILYVDTLKAGHLAGQASALAAASRRE